MAVIATYLEKKGIPVVAQVADLPNIKQIAKESYLAGAVPEMRSIFIPPAKFVEKWPDEDLPKVLDALTRPLTDAEKRSGKYKPPAAPRIAMTGTYDEVQEFFTGDLSAFVDTAPIARWTDGLPITPPTPEAVARMLKGTSHKPDEIVNPAMGPMKRPVTVEKVAINAVMAGCKPEQLPVCLAITQAGLSSAWTSSGSMGILQIVSGPIVKQIGMNAGTAFISPGNPANMAITRFSALAIKNLEGITHNTSLIQAYGTNLMGLTLPESPDTPWEGLNVRYGFSPKESVLIQLSGKVAFIGHETGEATHLSQQAEVPQQLVANMKAFVPGTGNNGRFIIINPTEARKWKEKFGWDTMAKLQDFLWDNVTWPRKMYDTSYWWGTRTPFKGYVATLKSERGSRMLNPDHVDLPPDALVPINPSPLDYIILVAGGGSPNYHDLQSAFSWGAFGNRIVLPIDKWK